MSAFCRCYGVGLLVTTLLCVSAASAEVYKWVGENGVVQYTNTPPSSGVSSEQVVVDECVTDECLAEQAAAAAEAQRQLQNTLRQLEEIDAAKRERAEAQVADGDEEKVTVPAKAGRTPPPILPSAARQQGLF